MHSFELSPIMIPIAGNLKYIVIKFKPFEITLWTIMYPLELIPLILKHIAGNFKWLRIKFNPF